MIPFVPFPKKVTKKFLWLGKLLLKTFPRLKSNLYKADIKISPVEYAALAPMSSLFWFIAIFSLIYCIGFINASPNFLLSFLFGFLFSGFTFFYLINYPRYVVIKKKRLLEKELLHALQHILIQVRSGISLYQAMIGVSSGYGELSELFKKIIKDINAGINEVDAIESAIKKNPSIHLRRSLWQISNAIKSGADIGDTLDKINENLMKENSLSIKRYGQELNPFMMIYMLFSVIFPSLSITFMILISVITGISIPSSIFLAVIFIMIAFQIFYIGLIKNRRPVMEV